MGAHHDQASETHAASAADTLSDVLETVRLTGAFFFVVEASTPWVAEAPASLTLAPVILSRGQHVISYHLILRGGCWCEMDGHDPVRLEAGDVIVVPHGDAYVLTTERGSRTGFTDDQTLGWFRAMACGQFPLVVEEGCGGSGHVTVVCGFLGCDVTPFNPILTTLPAVLHMHLSGTDGDVRLQMLIESAVRESRSYRPGARSVILRIGELVFVEVVRRYLDTLPPSQRGWLAGLRDPLVGSAMARLHERAADAWTLEQLAREVGASRSVLAERFTHLVGEPPMHYLTKWRMQRAARLLRDERSKVLTVAREVGYDSEAAFSRAFKKATGVAPAAWRRRHQ